MSDHLQPFRFPELPVRGQIVRLERTWQTILGDRRYPQDGEAILGQMVVIAAMLAHSVKLSGSVVLQTRGDGPLRTAMAECANRETLRGILRFVEPEPAHLPANPMGRGQLAITLRPAQGEPYQGLVDLSDGPFSASVERYFDRSEQLPTRIRVATTAEQAVGVLIQRLPSNADDVAGAYSAAYASSVAGAYSAAYASSVAGAYSGADASWQRVAERTARLTDESLLGESTETILRTTYAREVIRLDPGRTLAFGCSCSRDRATGALRAMGAAEIEALIAARETIDVSCEFCGARYDYDAIDARLLFEAGIRGPDTSLH